MRWPVIYIAVVLIQQQIFSGKTGCAGCAEDCLVFNNGAAAIFAGVLAHVKTGDHIVSVKPLYLGTTNVWCDPSKVWRNNYLYRWHQNRKLAASYQPNTTFYYLESPNSWNFALQDIAAVAAFAKQKGIITLIDNSYCSPLYSNRSVWVSICVCKLLPSISVVTVIR